MGVWRGTLYFADRRGISRMNIEFPNAAGVFDGAEFLSVKNAVGGIATAMEAASECRVGHSVTFFEEPVNVAGLAATVDRNDKLAITTYLDALQPNGSPKTWTFYLSGPVGAVLGPNADDADVDDPLLDAIMDAFASADALGMRVSDGEQIDYSLGANGIKQGSWISRKGT